MQDVNGLSFGGNVWSYGSIEAFKEDFEAAQKPQGATGGSEKTGALAKPKKSKKEPEDTGLTRYLGSTGSAAQKLAHLHDINKFVDDFRLNSKTGDLPETQELNKLKNLKNCLSPHALERKILSGDGGVDKTLKTLAQMLEQKTLAARRKVQGQENCQLSADERKNIEKVCRTALTKTFQAYTLDRFSQFTCKNRQIELATADKDAILNTALGAAELLMDGRINSDSVVTLLRDGSLIDLANTLDVTLMLQRAAINAKEQFTQKAELLKAAEGCSAKDREAIVKLIAARERFASVLDFQIHEHDPDKKLDDEKFLAKQLQEVKLRLQQFRYDLERCTGEVGKEFDHGKYSFYGVMEKLRRACSNLRGNRHLDVRFKTDALRKQAFADLRETEDGVLGRLSPQMQTKLAKTLGADKDLVSRAKTACKTTHDANDGARMSQETASARREEDAYACKVLDILQKTGGMQMVSTEISVSAVAQIGETALVSGQVAVGGFYKTSAAVVVGKNGGYSLVLSKSGGGRVTAAAGAGANSVQAQVNVEGGTGKETVLSFGSREELLVYCRQNCPKLMESIPGSFTDLADRDLFDEEAFTNVKSTVEWTGKVAKAAKFLGNVTGLRIHKTKYFTEANFEKRLRDDGVFGHIDGILYRRRNGLAVMRSQSTVDSGKVSTSAGLDVGTDEVGASLNAGIALGGATKKTLVKALKSAETIASKHTAREMKATLLPEEFQSFRDYQETAPAKYRNSTLATDLEKLVNSAPPKGASAVERAKFWSGMLTTLSTRYRTLEGDYSAPNTSKNVIQVKKDVQALQIDFARQTRLYAIVTEYVAKRIESELNTATSPEVKSSLRTSLKFARESLGATLARSNIVLRPDIVQKHLQFGREISGGKSREFNVQVSVGWDVGLKKSSDSDSSAGTQEATNAAVSMFKDAFMDAMGTLKADGEKALKGLLTLSGKVTGQLTVKNYADRGDTVQPWANANSVQIGLDVTYPLGPASLVETVVKLVEKAKAEHPGDRKWAQMLGQVSKEFAVGLGKQLGATALNEIDKAGTALVEPLVKLPVTLLDSGVKTALEKIGISLGISSTDSTGKGATLTLTFQSGKLTQCKMSDYVSYVDSLKLNVKAPAVPIGMGFGKTAVQRREQVSFDTMPRATLGTILGRAGEFLGGGLVGLNDFRTFLLKNQKAVNGLMKELRKTTTPGEPVYEDKSLQAIRDGLENLKTLAKTNDKRIPASTRKAATAAYDAAMKDWRKLVETPAGNEKDPARNDLLIKLSESLLKAYGLLSEAQGLGWDAPKT